MADDQPPESSPSETNVDVPPQQPVVKRSGRSGRASRRRRRKLRCIHQAEEAIKGRNSNNNNNNMELISTAVAAFDNVDDATFVLPRDRDKVWPAVYERRTFHKWSKEDETMLVGQLGYLPGNVINISTRADAVPCLLKTNQGDSAQAPVVIQLYPMVMRDEYQGGKSDGRPFKSRKRLRQNGEDQTPKNETDQNCHDDNSNNNNNVLLIEPFPTIYWLTHPILRVLIAKLELESLGMKLQQRLANDPEAMQSMECAHQSYGRERLRLLTESDVHLVQERKWESAFFEVRGIAGIRDHATIKCLHAHVAHFLSGGPGSSDNVVGRWVMGHVEKLLNDNDQVSDQANE